MRETIFGLQQNTTQEELTHHLHQLGLDTMAATELARYIQNTGGVLAELGPRGVGANSTASCRARAAGLFVLQLLLRTLACVKKAQGQRPRPGWPRWSGTGGRPNTAVASYLWVDDPEPGPA